MPRTIGLNVASAGAVAEFGSVDGKYAGGADGIGFLLISATGVQSRAALQSQSDQLDLHVVVKFKRLVQCNSNRYLEKGYLPIK